MNNNNKINLQLTYSLLLDWIHLDHTKENLPFLKEKERRERER
jgi:hypothetical protein